MGKFSSILIALINSFFIITSCNQNSTDYSLDFEEQIIGRWVLAEKEYDRDDCLPIKEIIFYKDKTIKIIDLYDNKMSGSYKFFSKFDVEHLDLKYDYQEYVFYEFEPQIMIKGDTLIINGDYYRYSRPNEKIKYKSECPFKYKYIRRINLKYKKEKQPSKTQSSKKAFEF